MYLICYASDFFIVIYKDKESTSIKKKMTVLMSVFLLVN